MSHESLIARLAADAEPVEPLASPQARAARWLLLAVLAVGIGVAVRGVRSNWAAAAGDPTFLVTAVLLLATGVSAAIVSMALAVPGAVRRGWVRWLPVLLMMSWGATVAVDAWLAPGALRPAGWGVGCLWKTWGLALGPATVLLVMARAAAPLDWRWTAATAALASLAFGVLGTEMICPMTGHAHILTWHFLPVAATAAAVFLAVAFWGRRAVAEGRNR